MFNQFELTQLKNYQLEKEMEQGMTARLPLELQFPLRSWPQECRQKEFDEMLDSTKNLTKRNVFQSTLQPVKTLTDSEYAAMRYDFQKNGVYDQDWPISEWSERFGDDINLLTGEILPANDGAFPEVGHFNAMSLQQLQRGPDVEDQYKSWSHTLKSGKEWTLDEPVPEVQVKTPKNKKNVPFCVFCKNNGEHPDVYLNHVCKDFNNKVQCPKLRLYKCPNCGAEGEDAHTIRHCPYKKPYVETPKKTQEANS